MIPLVMPHQRLVAGVAVLPGAGGPGGRRGHPADAGDRGRPSRRARRRSSAGRTPPIFVIGLGVAAIIFLLYTFVRPVTSHDPTSSLTWRIATTLAFCFGALCSGVASYVGMFVSIRANLRTASAVRTSLNRALQLALTRRRRVGPLRGRHEPARRGRALRPCCKPRGGGEKSPCSSSATASAPAVVALFAQLGGGIYTKAADVGADLVGKVEAGIPEDDPRNPAVIRRPGWATNVGDCAGRARTSSSRRRPRHRPP